MTFQTALNGAATITANNTPPALGTINSYNASGGALTAPLPALASQNVGASCIVEKNIADGSLNAVTFTANGTDTFDDGTASKALIRPGENMTIQVISIPVNSVPTKFWKITDSSMPRTGLVAIASEFTLASSTTATTIVSYPNPVATLGAGSSFRIKLYGTVQVLATSGTLTFTPFIQGTALNTIQLASQTSAEGPVGFWLENVITVRTTGTSGSAIAHGGGIIRFATNAQINQLLTSTNTATTTINTTSSASSNVLQLQAQWATNSASNSLKVETATIERVV